MLINTVMRRVLCEIIGSESGTRKGRKWTEILLTHFLSPLFHLLVGCLSSAGCLHGNTRPPFGSISVTELQPLHTSASSTALLRE